MTRQCAVCGTDKDVITYFDAWDGVRVVHNANVHNRGRETVLCREHDIFNSKELEDRLVKQLQMENLGDAIRYGDALDDKLLKEMRQKMATTTISTIEFGLDFMLSHFREPLFPRRVSTAATNKVQHTVLDKGHAMAYLEGASGVDCRISAFGVNQTNPDLIFIDLDACNFGTLRGLKLALTRTLNNIKDKLNAQPTILWSGRGYHVIQPIDCPGTVNLDEVKEFTALTDNPNSKFLQFAERYLTGNKQDSGHHPALKSCMLRVPHSHNAKCKEAGVDSEVKIMQ